MPQIVHLCGEGVLKPFCDLLAAKDDKTVGVVLDGVSNILATAEKLSEVDKVTSKWCFSPNSTILPNIGGNDGGRVWWTGQDRAAAGPRE